MFRSVKCPISQEGVSGLQIHKGIPAEAWCKDIMIRDLPGKQ